MSFPVRQFCDSGLSVSMFGSGAVAPGNLHDAIARVTTGLGSTRRITQTVELFKQYIPYAFWAALKYAGLMPEDSSMLNGGD